MPRSWPCRVLPVGLSWFFTGHQIAVDPKTTMLPTTLMGVEVTGSTMGIVGMGDIGYKIAQRGRGFEMKILYHNRRRREVSRHHTVECCFKLEGFSGALTWLLLYFWIPVVEMICLLGIMVYTSMLNHWGKGVKVCKLFLTCALSICGFGTLLRVLQQSSTVSTLTNFSLHRTEMPPLPKYISSIWCWIQHHFRPPACLGWAFRLSSFRSVKEEQAVGATYCQSLDELLRESDFVVLAVNLTPETTGLISHRELSLMKSTATLVNISRGDSCVFHCLQNVHLTAGDATLVISHHVSGLVVDQDALVEALRSGTIRGAALDVTYPEPLPRSDHAIWNQFNSRKLHIFISDLSHNDCWSTTEPRVTSTSDLSFLCRDHPLLGFPNVVITPHIGTNTVKTCRMMVEAMVNNSLAVLTGQPIPNEVRAEWLGKYLNQSERKGGHWF